MTDYGTELLRRQLNGKSEIVLFSGSEGTAVHDGIFFTRG